MYKASEWKLEKMDASEIVKLQAVLDEVSEHHKRLYEWHDSLLQEYKDRMLMIEFTSHLWGAWESTNKICDRNKCDANRDGDGRVPLASALLEDVTTRFVQGEHGGLHNIPAVAQEVLAWLKDDTLELAATCKGALGGHLSGTDFTPLTPLLNGGGDGAGAAANKFRNLPEYENPTEEFKKEIARKLDAGEMPQVNLVKLL